MLDSLQPRKMFHDATFQIKVYACILSTSAVLLAAAVEYDHFIAHDQMLPFQSELGQVKQTNVPNPMRYDAAVRLPEPQAQTSQLPDAHKAVQTHLTPSTAPIGRYVLSIQCQSTACTIPGHAELIMTLLPDGTAHRVLVHKGQILIRRDYAHTRAPMHSLDRWFWDAATQQLRIVSAQGHQFIYRLDHQRQLHLLNNNAHQATPIASRAELDQVQLELANRVWLPSNGL